MFKKSISMVLGLSALGAFAIASGELAFAQSAPQAAPETSSVATCLAMNQTDQIVDCLNKSFDSEDDLLNRAYQNVMGQLNTDSKTRTASLRLAELAWIRFRDAQCKYDFTAGDGGDDSGVADLVCRISQTIKRRVDLEQEFVKLRKKNLY